MLRLYDQTFASRLLLGTAKYPSPQHLADAVAAAGPAILTVGLRREGAAGAGFQRLLADTGVALLPNTAGCQTVHEALTTAQMARELLQTEWIKLEVVTDEQSLHPDAFALVEAARVLVAEGFKVLPYCTEDLSLARALLNAGCEALMPWGAPIGSARGLRDPLALTALRGFVGDTPLIVDAGLGRPSHAAAAMELGMDGVLLNTALAGAGDPVLMARAFAQAVAAGRTGWEAQPVAERAAAVASTSPANMAVLS